MPVHDWTRVDASVFYDFLNAWIAELRNVLNSDVLSAEYYALSEQHAGRQIADVLTLHTDPAQGLPRRTRRKTLTIRHVSDHRIVAVVEIVSPANKDRHEHVEELLDKAEDILNHGIHMLIVDLFIPGSHDPQGIHGALWERLGDQPEAPPGQEPFTLASYVADSIVKAYIEHLAVGSVLPNMPLFLDPDYYVSVPLEAAYEIAWRGTPAHWRTLLDDATT